VHHTAKYRMRRESTEDTIQEQTINILSLPTNRGSLIFSNSLSKTFVVFLIPSETFVARSNTPMMGLDTTLIRMYQFWFLLL
jgi:hypothetical protein